MPWWHCKQCSCSRLTLKGNYFCFLIFLFFTPDDGPSSAKEGKPSSTKYTPLQLANSLAACCLSSRLASQHREWAAQQLVKTLASQVQESGGKGAPIIAADLHGDLPACPSRKPDAHQGGLMACLWSTKKSLLATRYWWYLTYDLINVQVSFQLYMKWESQLKTKCILW